MRKPVVDYRKLRFSNLNSDEFRHLWYLSFWPIYLVSFFMLEAFPIRENYFPIYCKLDDYIPFLEVFVIPYVFWYVFMFSMHIYTLLYNIPAFKRMMRFFSISFGISVLIFIVFPNGQDLRATEITRDNFFMDIVRGLYAADTNTNVFPSLHVVGSLATVFAAWDLPEFSSPLAKSLFLIVGAFTSLSTVFIKQHSFLDILGGIAVSLLVYIIVYKLKWKRGEKNG